MENCTSQHDSVKKCMAIRNATAEGLLQQGENLVSEGFGAIYYNSRVLTFLLDWPRKIPVYWGDIMTTKSLCEETLKKFPYPQNNVVFYSV